MHPLLRSTNSKSRFSAKPSLIPAIFCEHCVKTTARKKCAGYYKADWVFSHHFFDVAVELKVLSALWLQVSFLKKISRCDMCTFSPYCSIHVVRIRAWFLSVTSAQLQRGFEQMLHVCSACFNMQSSYLVKLRRCPP